MMGARYPSGFGLRLCTPPAKMSLRFVSKSTDLLDVGRVPVPVLRSRCRRSSTANAYGTRSGADLHIAGKTLQFDTR